MINEVRNFIYELFKLLKDIIEPIVYGSVILGIVYLIIYMIITLHASSCKHYEELAKQGLTYDGEARATWTLKKIDK